MITIDSMALNKNPKRLRHTVQEGSEVGLTFRDNIYAAVIPIEQRHAEQAEMADLQKRVAELEQVMQSITELQRQLLQLQQLHQEDPNRPPLTPGEPLGQSHTATHQ